MFSGRCRNAETVGDTPVIAFDVPQERERCVEHTGEFLAEHAVANEPAATAPGSLTPALVSAQMRFYAPAGFGVRPNQLPRTQPGRACIICLIPEH